MLEFRPLEFRLQAAGRLRAQSKPRDIRPPRRETPAVARRPLWVTGPPLAFAFDRQPSGGHLATGRRTRYDKCEFRGKAAIPTGRRGRGWRDSRGKIALTLAPVQGW